MRGQIELIFFWKSLQRVSSKRKKIALYSVQASVWCFQVCRRLEYRPVLRQCIGSIHRALRRTARNCAKHSTMLTKALSRFILELTPVVFPSLFRGRVVSVSVETRKISLACNLSKLLLISLTIKLKTYSVDSFLSPCEGLQNGSLHPVRCFVWVI